MVMPTRPDGPRSSAVPDPGNREPAVGTVESRVMLEHEGAPPPLEVAVVALLDHDAAKGATFGLVADADYGSVSIMAQAARRNYLQSLHAEVADKGVYVGMLYVGAVIENSAFHTQIEGGEGRRRR